MGGDFAPHTLGMEYKASRDEQRSTAAATDASIRANDAALAEQRRQYDLNRKDLSPYVERGSAAMSVLADLMGLNGPDAQTKAFANFREDPGAQYSTDAANQALERSALARGNLMSGGFAADLTKLNRGLADAQYGDYLGRLLNLAGIGRGTATGMAEMGTGIAGNISSLLNRGGDITASGILGREGIASNLMKKKAKDYSSFENNTVNSVLDIVGSLYGANGNMRSKNTAGGPVSYSNTGTGYGYNDGRPSVLS